MAKLKNKILGKVSGSLGDITFRQRNGINYLSMRPAKYNTPSDEESVKRRSKFRLAVKLASAVNSIKLLKNIWSESVPNGSSVYNFLVQEYFRILNIESLHEDVNLTPGYGFAAEAVTVTQTDNQISVTASAIGVNAGIDIGAEPKIDLVAIMFLTLPTKTSLEPAQFIPIEFPEIDTVLNSQLNFTYSVSSQLAGLMSGYGQQQLLFALTTLDESKKPAHYSNTFAQS